MLLRRTLDGLYLLAGAMAAFCIFSIGALMLAQVAMREMGLNLRGADDLTSWACAASAILAIAHTFKRGDLVRVGLLLERLKGRARWWVEIFALSVSGLFAGYFAWWMGWFVYESWEFHETAPGLLPIPLWIPQLPLVFGAVVFFVALLDELATVLSGGTTSYQLAADARRDSGDFSGEL